MISDGTAAARSAIFFQLEHGVFLVAFGLVGVGQYLVDASRFDVIRVPVANLDAFFNHFVILLRFQFSAEFLDGSVSIPPNARPVPWYWF